MILVIDQGTTGSTCLVFDDQAGDGGGRRTRAGAVTIELARGI
jgi:glycerol kinase